jgi:hypothetical protein
MRIWRAPPDRIREERDGELGGWRLGIRRGGSWWALDKDGLPYSNEQDPEVGTDIGESTAHFFDPRPLVGALKLEVIGETQLAGREAIRLRGARRSAQQLAELDFELRLAGDECELDVDAERGVLLRMLACHESLGSSLEEVIEIGFDETFPCETFAPIAGVPARSEVAAREIRVGEAADLVAFPVRIPPPLAEGWTLQASYFPGDERAREPEAIVLDLVHEEFSHHVRIAETAAGTSTRGENDRGWQPARHEGRDFDVARPERRTRREASVRFEQGGTRVLISSRDFALDHLLELAAAVAG